MILRIATTEDIPEIVKLFRMFVQSSPLAALMGEEDLEATVAFAAGLTGTGSFAAVAELPEARGTLVGVIAVDMYRLGMFDTGLSRDLFVYAHPTYRGLWMRRIFELAEAEARRRGSRLSFYHCIGADPEHNVGNAEFLEKTGYQTLGKVMVKQL